jgi:acyl-CoA dehydrogenase
MDFDLFARSEAWCRKLQAFFDKEVLPRHRAWLDHVVQRHEAAPFMGELQAKARAAGLWNLGLPELAEDEPGTRLSNLDYAPLAEIMGRLFWAPEVFNCQAPDVPNMIALQNCATPEQKERWLRPLLNAETRSAFGMTEPDVASSDATNIATKMIRDGNDYVITGRKWFITGAAHPRCSFLIVLGVTSADAERTRRHSCVIVPMATPGVRPVRRLDGLRGSCRADRRACLRQCPRAPRKSARRRGRGLQGRAGSAWARAPSPLHALDRIVRTPDRVDDGACLRTIRLRTAGHSI